MDEGTAVVADQYDGAARTWHRQEDALGLLTVALGSRTGTVPAGATLLDVGCGTGEPGLTLVETSPGARLVGIDVAPAMIALAGDRAVLRGVQDARFAVAAAEDLPLGDATVSAVVSRMGLLAFPGSSVRAADEAFRVLEPGGRLALATWGRLADHVALDAVVAACRHVGGRDAVDLGWMDDLADGRRERWLREAGFVHVTAESLPFTMHVADLDELWLRAGSAGPLAGAIGALGSTQQLAARDHVAARLAHHRGPDGSYALPAVASLLSATRPAA